jgi:hypothetical protein
MNAIATNSRRIQMKSGFLVSTILVITVVLMAGCGAMGALDARSQVEKLERSLTQYGAALRWARYREAISFHVTREEKFAEVDIENLENFGVTSFDVLSKVIVPSSEKGGVNEAAIVAEISYFHKEQGTVRKLKLNQIWWYNTKIKRWLIETDFPEFK